MSEASRWDQVKALFQAALHQASSERPAFLRQACGRDEQLRLEIESLLDAHDQAGTFAQPPLDRIASRGDGSARPAESTDWFGPYEIVTPLGAGGMGEVYLARDTRLNRDVALKVLPEAFALDAMRLVRFKREAHVLASLNHPNIAAIYGLAERPSEAGSNPPAIALVLEFAEGPTLAQRISHGRIPIADALRVARQICDALEVAHERGIVHRDLKPANIKLRPDGVVKVLDFGLAKTFGNAPTDEANGIAPVMIAETNPGAILGTTAYMSPEQARGRPVDKRTDIWAFGCVLYEMLAARPAFAGDDETEIMAAVVRGEPAWKELPPDTPPRVVTLLRRCLDKDPQLRLRDIGDARLMLDGAFEIPDSGRHEPRPMARSAATHVAIYALVLLLGAAVAGVVTWSRLQTASSPVTRMSIELGPNDSFSFTGRRVVAASPDGRQIVYAANERLYLRSLNQLQATALPGTEDRARSPFFSPDGQQIAFWAPGDLLKSVSVSGGAPVTLCRIGLPWGASWEPDNTILLGEGPDGIWRVSAAGGTPEAIIRVGAGEAAHGPHLLPGGEWVLFTLLPRGSQSWSEAQIVAHSLTSGERRVLIHGGHDAQYLPTGHLLYALNGNLLAVAFDVANLRLTGGARIVVEGVADAAGTTGASHFSVTSSGTLAYVTPIPKRLQHTLAWIDRHGRETAINIPVRPYIFPRIAPDGTRAAVDVRDDENDIWIWDFARETLTRLTRDTATDRPPLWTPDGRRIAFASDRDGGGLFWQAADGTGPVERLVDAPADLFPTAFSPDATQLLFWAPFTTATIPTAAPSDIWMVTPRNGTRPNPLIRTPSIERNAEISPDGRWIAYQSDESGQTEVYVRPFPNVEGGRWQVSTGGGERPLWARSGRELFYLSPDALMSVSVAPAQEIRIGKPARLFDAGAFFRDKYFPGRTYDISPDDERFLFVKKVTPTDLATPPHLVLVMNWREELEQRVPGAR